MKTYNVTVQFQINADDQWSAMHKIARELDKLEQVEQIPDWRVVAAAPADDVVHV
jgi:hypothetical protein